MDDEEGRSDPSETSSHLTGIPGWGSQGLKISQKIPFMNPNPLTQWSGPENIAQVKIDGQSSWAFLHSGSTINVVTPGFVEAPSMDVGPLSDLADGTLVTYGFGGVFSQHLGYVIIRVQVEGVWGYDEDQVALVIPASTICGSRVPVTLGTPTINQIINMIKESEIDGLSAFLNRLKMAQLLACQQTEPLIQGEAAIHQTVDPTDLKGAIKMTKNEEIDTFLSKIIHGQVKTMLLGNNMQVMTQALNGGDGPHLPHGPSVVNMYIKVISGSKWVTVVVKNLMAALITIAKGAKVTQVVAVNAVPQWKWHQDLWRS